METLDLLVEKWATNPGIALAVIIILCVFTIFLGSCSMWEFKDK